MEQDLLKKRIRELSHLSYERDIPLNTGFLTLEEQDVFIRMKRELSPGQYVLWGGYEMAERKAVCFLPDYFDIVQKELLPIQWIKIAPKAEKFAEELTHRDYLGSLMSLGIERDRMGDILIDGKTAYLCALSDIADFICMELTQVRHTQVTCECISLPDSLAVPKIEERTGSVSSERLDAVIALAFRLSRGAASDTIKAGYVFVNGRQMYSPGQELKEQDVISVRHRGKFQYRGVDGHSKKGRLIIKIGMYI